MASVGINHPEVNRNLFIFIFSLTFLARHCKSSSYTALRIKSTMFYSTIINLPNFEKVLRCVRQLQSLFLVILNLLVRRSFLIARRYSWLAKLLNSVYKLKFEIRTYSKATEIWRYKFWLASSAERNFSHIVVGALRLFILLFSLSFSCVCVRVCVTIPPDSFFLISFFLFTIYHIRALDFSKLYLLKTRLK